jgi:DNA-binding MarR family transcriptional regulator
MPKSSPDTLQLDRFLPYRLSVLSNTMSTAIAAHYKQRFGLTIPEWRIMAVLAREPGLVAAQVAERTAMDKVAVSRGVARLTKSGHLLGRAVRVDLRRLSLRLSARGRAVYEEVAPWALAYERAVLSNLSAAQLRTLDAVLAQLDRSARAVDPAEVASGRGR